MHALIKHFTSLCTNQTPPSTSSCVPKSSKNFGHELDGQPNQHRNQWASSINDKDKKKCRLIKYNSTCSTGEQ